MNPPFWMLLFKVICTPAAWAVGYRYVIDRDDHGDWRCYPVEGRRA